MLLRDRKSTRLNSSHGYISYAVFCLKKKKMPDQPHRKILDRLDRELLRQDVEGVFHRVGGQDLTIIAGGMSRPEVALELDRKSGVPNLVLLFPPGNAQKSHARLSIIILSQSYIHRISSRDRSNSRTGSAEEEYGDAGRRRAPERPPLCLGRIPVHSATGSMLQYRTSAGRCLLLTNLAPTSLQFARPHWICRGRLPSMFPRWIRFRAQRKSLQRAGQLRYRGRVC